MGRGTLGGGFKLPAAVWLAAAGWNLEAANGVSADGLTIVGYGTNPSGDTEGWIAVIPEPSTGLLLALGLAGLAAAGRRGVV